VRWYNTKLRHGGIRHVTPEQRHAGTDADLLADRHSLYRQARARKPARWNRHTRNWSPITAVALNPEKDSVVAIASTTSKSVPMAA